MLGLVFHGAPVLWLMTSLAVIALLIWVARRGSRQRAAQDPLHLRTFVTFDAVPANDPDPGSVLFTKILAALPKEIVVPPGQSTAVAHTGYTSIAVHIGDWKAEIFLGDTDPDTNLWTLFVEPQTLVDTPELRTLLKALNEAVTNIPETNQVEWYKRETPEAIATSPIDE